MNTQTIYEEYMKKKSIDNSIPATMPYTYEEVFNCKTRSRDVLKKDFENIVKFPADVNPRKFCGNNILYHYQMKNLLACRRGNKNWKTLKEWFDDDELKEKLWQLTVKINRRDKAPYPSPTDVYECHRKCNGSIVFFKSSTAKYIYKMFHATNVLDPTAGWGGRLLGASSLDIKYTGYDTNINMKEAYDNMKNDGFSNEKQKMVFEDCLRADFTQEKYDLVLTSPPYSNMEIYEHMTPWEKDEDYYKDFLIPLLNKLHEETNCPICINVSPKIYRTLIKKFNYKECDTQIDLRQQMGEQFKKKSQDYIYIWRHQ
tara:strand:- start:478 stop:1419 length:942 start_codon:yes stop_codon:yes gene_type:complete